MGVYELIVINGVNWGDYPSKNHRLFKVPGLYVSPVVQFSPLEIWKTISRSIGWQKRSVKTLGEGWFFGKFFFDGDSLNGKSKKSVHSSG